MLTWFGGRTADPAEDQYSGLPRRRTALELARPAGSLQWAGRGCGSLQWWCGGVQWCCGAPARTASRPGQRSQPCLCSEPGRLEAALAGRAGRAGPAASAAPPPLLPTCRCAVLRARFTCTRVQGRSGESEQVFVAAFMCSQPPPGKILLVFFGRKYTNSVNY